MTPICDNSIPNKQALTERLQGAGQAHLLVFGTNWTWTNKPIWLSRSRGLISDLIASLHRGEVDQPDWAELSRRAAPPSAVRLAERASGVGGGLGINDEAAVQRGGEALRTGKVGAILTAGGQGSRLGFELPKSLYPIGPLSSASLLQIHIEKTSSHRRALRRLCAAVPDDQSRDARRHRAVLGRERQLWPCRSRSDRLLPRHHAGGRYRDRQIAAVWQGSIVS